MCYNYFEILVYSLHNMGTMKYNGGIDNYMNNCKKSTYKRIFNRKRLVIWVIIFAFVMPVVSTFSGNTDAYAAQTGTVNAGVTNVLMRTGPGTNYDKVKAGNSTLYLNGGDQLTVLDTNNNAWYKVQFAKNGSNYEGYVSSQFITLGDQVENPNPGPVVTPVSPEAMTDFEAYLTSQGFPESYKVDLRKIHEQHPTWLFQAVNTNIDWNTLISNEINKNGFAKNLVWTSSSQPHYNWRSTTVGYDYTTDTWRPFDGKVWFAASDELVTYYLDPRTYLDDRYIFVFECLSYQEGLQTIDGVEAILAGSFMANSAPEGENKTYSQMMMDAAVASNVSPYHIASRIKQEMGNTIGTASSGKTKGYEGIYNFFNIGASDSANGNAAIKGLEWAASSGSYDRPWDSVPKAITNGSKYLAKGYISLGQDTLYTQKFNVTNRASLFSHQYMTNVQAPSTEALKIYDAYASNNILDKQIIFKIPVYTNMPDAPSAKPADSGNPNNYLKALSIDGYSITPSFSVNTVKDYSLIVPSSTENITIHATAVNDVARVTGTGNVAIAEGTNIIYINVKAQNGSVRTYTLTVVRGDANAGRTEIGSPESSTTPAPSTPDVPVAPDAPSTPSGIRGDLNGDGKISAKDIVAIQRVIVGLDPTDSSNIANYDLNKDGKVSAKDIVMIQRHIVGLESLY